MLLNISTPFPMGNAEIPIKVLTNILVYAKDPKLGQICKVFYEVIKSEDFWKIIGKDLAEYDIELVKKLSNQGNTKGFIQPLFKGKIHLIRLIQPDLLRTQGDRPLDAYRYASLETFLCLYFKCRVRDQDFKLSSSFDSNNFDDKKRGSVKYCIDYMRSYLINMHGMEWLMESMTITALKNKLNSQK